MKSSADRRVIKMAVEELNKRAKWNDYEIAHTDADKILCAALKYFGAGEIVEAYNKVGKWYA